ncbi:RhuM family protein [Acidithiobacillus ferriphilus]|uniref:RhuM family protein n=1 Tax=Acidithiobacillus ferriphilus TaxID=1689834 RepID=UPI002DB6FB01|nr:RhuM family protein [Acidithiobacillus ferriphilus]MEB8475005.1 RhuM family protein [Acidithiobacillus ferriphilus]
MDALDLQVSILLYPQAGGSDATEVRLEGDTVWLTQKQMAELFATTPENILMHLKNVYQEGELRESVTAKDFLVVRQEGKRQVKRQLKHYNLDAIISVGYRVNSTQATHFRQWATRVLREHLTQGFSIEERAAHLLYFVIKNHPFSDGNKRSGAFLFLLYLRQEGMRLTLDENGLTALTLLIAESDPKAKDLMVRLVMNLLAVDPGTKGDA